MTRKQTIMDTATRLFAEKGFHNTSTVEIAEAAGVAHGTLFYHYKNKEGIIYEIFRHVGELYINEMQAAIALHETGMAQIEALLHFNSAFSRSHSRQLLIFLRDFPEKLTSPDSPLKDLIKNTGEQVVGIIARCLETGVADRSLTTPEPRKTAYILNGLIFGLLHMNLLSPIEIPDLEENVNEFCRAALATAGAFNSNSKQMAR